MFIFIKQKGFYLTLVEASNSQRLDFPQRASFDKKKCSCKGPCPDLWVLKSERCILFYFAFNPNNVKRQTRKLQVSILKSLV